MKMKLRSLLVLAVSLAFITACKKTSTATSDPQLSASQVSGQVALTLDQSLFGDMGAFDLSNGVGSAESYMVRKKGKTINDVGDVGCGFVADTTLSTTLALGADSSLTIGETLNFATLCTGDQLSGFTTNDNVSIAFAGPSLSLAYKVSENLTFSILDINNPDYSSTSLKGTLGSNGSYQYKTGTKRTGTAVFSYTITSLVIDYTGAIVSGSATFSSSATGPRGAWNYSGSITFLGGDKATVTISGKTYNVSLSTGVVS